MVVDDELRVLDFKHRSQAATRLVSPRRNECGGDRPMGEREEQPGQVAGSRRLITLGLVPRSKLRGTNPKVIKESATQCVWTGRVVPETEEVTSYDWGVSYLDVGAE